ncbi:Procollagen C-endopeptidase enhancer 1-like protein [Leptotrombidium deliense]|uniref:Procollagen C-endopeptidase enhancer 1-like protein n=1 Tax=Leptotrombidium deliense TaxID=299467 RepID=A0A443S4X2_9ACAR|nr:Procollagen C-endopeptidase enhancer 1-like protein [Leptotrombidium deliense]
MFASSSLVVCSECIIIILVIACLQRSLVTGNHEIESTFKANKENKCNRNVDVYETINEPALTDENRGKPLHCSYRIRIRPERNDWMVFLRFTRFKIGDVSPDRKECIGGYIAIIDGYKDSNVSKHTNPVEQQWKHCLLKKRNTNRKYFE